ncbi:MAG: hypothetical protein U9Q03_00540 [Patescibacteria group bacterium]|nr:hypothetical protein [Patescibacteria group bacterium]
MREEILNIENETLADFVVKVHADSKTLMVDVHNPDCCPGPSHPVSPKSSTRIPIAMTRPMKRCRKFFSGRLRLKLNDHAPQVAFRHDYEMKRRGRHTLRLLPYGDYSFSAQLDRPFEQIEFVNEDPDKAIVASLSDGPKGTFQICLSSDEWWSSIWFENIPPGERATLPPGFTKTINGASFSGTKDVHWHLCPSYDGTLKIVMWCR